MSDGAFRSSDELADVTYRGLKVAERARLQPDGAERVFVQHEAPLPVGARVTLLRDGQSPIEARVVGVVELEAGAKSPPGMMLSWGSGRAAASPAEEPRDTTVMPAVIEPADEGVPDAQEPHDTVVMAAVPEPVDESSERSMPNPDESTPGTGRRGKKNRRKPNGR